MNILSSLNLVSTSVNLLDDRLPSAGRGTSLVLTGYRKNEATGELREEGSCRDYIRRSSQGCA